MATFVLSTRSHLMFAKCPGCNRDAPSNFWANHTPCTSPCPEKGPKPRRACGPRRRTKRRQPRPSMLQSPSCFADRRRGSARPGQSAVSRRAEAASSRGCCGRARRPTCGSPSPTTFSVSSSTSFRRQAARRGLACSVTRLGMPAHRCQPLHKSLREDPPRRRPCWAAAGMHLPGLPFRHSHAPLIL